ncbi:hypothetical protein [Ammonifex thiophilus]|uniref:Uncharacterized protein n=1 Tax=Ammonifex thiophilus TaxID=444093 RepID=A0A3D8P1B0_9THEO|nr:hypothetical protein [Ammonifex thiophilus]RDV81201.1 hypothetical protein DXX99_09690 [Ammonifex thiophilus]
MQARCKKKVIRWAVGSLLVVLGFLCVTGITKQALGVVGGHVQGLAWDFYLLFLGGAVYAAGLFYLILYGSFLLTFAWLLQSQAEHRHEN